MRCYSVFACRHSAVGYWPFLALIIALIGVTNAQSICTSPPSLSLTIDPTALIGVALLALSVSLDVVAIGYVIAKLVPNTGLSSWISKEFWEIAKTAILIGAIYSILIFLGGVANTLVGNAAPSTLNAQMSQLTVSAQSYLFNIYCGSAPNTFSQGSKYLTSLSLSTGGMDTLAVGYVIPWGALLFILLPEAPLFYGGVVFRAIPERDDCHNRYDRRLRVSSI